MNCDAGCKDAAGWDAFLERCERGQFQQTTGWARTKGAEGWKATRVFRGDPGRDGFGFQLLWKTTRWGRIGYISKGPVVAEESSTAVGTALAAVRDCAGALRFRALILQPPDASAIGSDTLVRCGFESAPVDAVIRSTAVVDLTGGPAAIEANMNSKRRYQVRAASKRGVVVRWGGRDDLPLFFHLMSESCRRQGTSPNPSHPGLLSGLWDAFPGKIHVGFASLGGEVLAGLLMIAHRRRMTLWKKGWNEQGATLFANSLINAEGLYRAAAEGFAEADFAGVRLDIAQTLLRGDELSAEQQKSRDVFNLRMGAQPRLLPAAHLLIVNPGLRLIFRAALKVPKLKAKLLGKLGAG